MGLFDIFGTGDQRDAANSQIAGINAGYGQLSDQFNQGRQALQSNYSAALQPFQQNYAQAGQGATQYGNALGLNGAAGNAAALQGFQNNPGYQFQLDQGSQNVLRNQAATGQLNSGKTNIDLQNYGQGVANQSWQQYVQNLQPYLQQQQAAATGIGTVNTGLGNQLNQSFTNQGNAAYGAQTSIGNANANADLAGLNASGNLLNFGMNLFKGGAQGAPSVAQGIGSFAGDLLGAFL